MVHGGTIRGWQVFAVKAILGVAVGESRRQEGRRSTVASPLIDGNGLADGGRFSGEWGCLGLQNRAGSADGVDEGKLARGGERSEPGDGNSGPGVAVPLW